jgi:capsular exopolysaccharide synthesis family protein
MKEIESRIPRLSFPEQAESESVYLPTFDEVHVRDYWKIVVKRRRLIALIVLFTLSIGAYTTFTATRVYTSTSMLKIEPQNPRVTGVGEMVSGSEGGGPYDYYQTQFKMLQSRSLAAMVIQELNLESNAVFTRGTIISSNMVTRIRAWLRAPLEFFVSHVTSIITSVLNALSKKDATRPKESEEKGEQLTSADPNLSANPSRWTGRYVSFLRVNPVKNTRLVEVQFTTPDPGLSQTLANAHARGFIRLGIKNRFELTKEARDYLDKKHSDLRVKLERSEEDLNRFRKTHGVLSMEGGENIVVNRLIELNRQLTTARAVRIEAETIYQIVENKPIHHLKEVVSQGMIPALRSNLLTLEAEKVKLSTVFKPDHPRILELNRQVDEMRRTLSAEIATVVKGIAENYAAARAKEEALEAETRKQQAAALKLKQLGVEYAVLADEVKVNRTLYEGVLKRLNETDVSNDLAVSNVQIVQSAENPGGPSAPDPVSNLILAGFGGLLLGMALAFVLEYLDSRLATPEQVWRSVGLNTFGVVPQLRSPNGSLFRDRQRWQEIPFIRKLALGKVNGTSASPKELIVSHHPLSAVTESYRTIRTALLFSHADKPPQVIVLTSPSPGEGKTLTTLNLGISLVQDGYRVLVVDADLRKGTCDTRLGIKNHRGLSNVLTSDLSFEEAVRESAVGGLSLLSHGMRPVNPSNLLASRKMRETLDKARQSFDFVLIDSPPVIAVSDAVVLGTICDGVILVFNGRQTTTAWARQAVERLNAVRAPVLGAILNNVDLNNPDFASYRYYYGPGERLEKSVQGTIDEVVYNEQPEIEGEMETQGLEIVPQEMLHQMTAKFIEAIGPMAPSIIQDHIAALGESSKACPKDKLPVLVERLGREITNDAMRLQFLKSMQDELRRSGK